MLKSWVILKRDLLKEKNPVGYKQQSILKMEVREFLIFSSHHFTFYSVQSLVMLFSNQLTCSYLRYKIRKYRRDIILQRNNIKIHFVSILSWLFTVLNIFQRRKNIRIKKVLDILMKWCDLPIKWFAEVYEVTILN